MTGIKLLLRIAVLPTKHSPPFIQAANFGPVYASEHSQWTIDVTVSTDKPAAFVWLDTKTDRPGRFSDNGFLLSTSTKTVSFWSEVAITSDELAGDLTIQDLAQIIR